MPGSAIAVLFVVAILVVWLGVTQYRDRTRPAEAAAIAGKTHDRRPSLFISYRRADASAAGRIVDGLAPYFRVVRDVDSIGPGADHRSETERLIGSSDIVLVVMGRGFVDKSESGDTRLHDEGDFVRAEIRQALQKDPRAVFPVLVGGVAMPSEDDLPSDICEFAHRNAVTLRDDPFFHTDCAHLTSKLDDAARSLNDPRRG